MGWNEQEQGNKQNRYQQKLVAHWAKLPTRFIFIFAIHHANRYLPSFRRKCMRILSLSSCQISILARKEALSLSVSPCQISILTRKKSLSLSVSSCQTSIPARKCPSSYAWKIRVKSESPEKDRPFVSQISYPPRYQHQVRTACSMFSSGFESLVEG